MQRWLASLLLVAAACTGNAGDDGPGETGAEQSSSGGGCNVSPQIIAAGVYWDPDTTLVINPIGACEIFVDACAGAYLSISNIDVSNPQVSIDFWSYENDANGDPIVWGTLEGTASCDAFMGTLTRADGGTTELNLPRNDDSPCG